ncbi:MAG: alpha/beta fold hydrolase [Betaproteobacteria bacterium]|nr:MAG: alpha/beta fold hydrolase [Betaproteobacteria bacterium]TMI05323.1 MAG: alpha/beta fold hydrolase [Betaproteobacteria bacterium]
MARLNAARKLQMQRLRRFVIACLTCVATSTAQSQSDLDSPKYQEVFYSSGNLRIQAYLYKPDGDGPFPAVIYNHGTRDGRERASFPFPHVGRMLTRASYAVLVPERRGYGKSDGEIWWQEVGQDQSKVILRLQAETDDVLAGAEYLRTLPYVDKNRLAVMGWSFGGVVTMLATTRSTAFVAAVDQAGGALTWDGNSHMRGALIAAAEKSATPTLFMVAKNDRTTSSITTLADIFKKRNIPHQLVIYEPFTPSQAGRAAPGHAIFSSQGASLWEHDVLEFLGRHLK